jgi:phosphonopyruvate decarboxylase
MKKQKKSFALVIQKNVFEPLQTLEINNSIYPKREHAIKFVLKHLHGNEVIVSTTGKISRELYENRVDKKDCQHDFYNIGAMGCAQSIAFGIALQHPKKSIIVFDGDGSLLMQLGALATIGHYKPKNLFHIVFDNTAHDSTGGQPTCADTVSFENVAKVKELKVLMRYQKQCNG